VDFQKVIALATRRGIFQPAFDAYGGLAGFIDYGPVGVKMRRRILETWRNHYVIDAGCLELDGALIGPEALFQASGHLGEFDDALVDCEDCGKQFRADHLIDGGEEMSRNELSKAISGMACPSCGALLSEMTSFNLMFSTGVGAGKGLPGYLRPETAQSIFLAFPWLLRQNRGKLPFAGAQIGRSFRNEISPRQGPLRMREFTQMEVEHFFLPNDEPKLSDDLKKITITLLTSNGKETKSTIGEAFDAGSISSSLVACHLARRNIFSPQLEFLITNYDFANTVQMKWLTILVIVGMEKSIPLWVGLKSSVLLIEVITTFLHTVMLPLKNFEFLFPELKKRLKFGFLILEN